MKKLVFLIVFFGFVNASFAQIKVYSISNEELKVKENMYVYSLPKVVFQVKVNVATECFYPGPFAQYAEKYLIISDVKTEYSEFSDISNIEIIPKYITDFDASFVVQSKKEPKIYLNENGVISSYGVQIDSDDNLLLDSDLLSESFEFSNFHFPLFTDLTVEKNFSNITDTTYKVVQIDSMYQKIPVYNTSITSKTFEQKAEEAANFILKIREEKFFLLAGMFEWENPPTELEFMVAKLEELEKEYLSLFIGKVEYKYQEYDFEIIPDGNVETQKVKLLNLHAEEPVQVYFELTKNQKHSKISNFYKNKANSTKANKPQGLYYRIPGNATIKVKVENVDYYKANVVVPQFGQIEYLPIKMFKNKKLKIIFNENYGSIQSIGNE